MDQTGPDHTGYDHRTIETKVRALWESYDIYRFDRTANGPVFSVDTPPPYVSASNLHVGHAMSYSQPDFVVRYRRMRGERVFYPMGFDDNGLPTERYVEQTHDVRAVDLPRADFVDLCLAETRRIAVGYEELWRRLGLSVDWSLRYSTIEPTSQRLAQASFITLFHLGRIARVEDPILWCPECRTALAQADVEDLSRTGNLHQIAFAGSSGRPLVIATTRPELLAACVALYHHPDDERYRTQSGGTARVPLFGHEVPIRADGEVDPAFGTGLMMVCTFGDSEDVARWRRDGLDLRLVVTEDGRLGEAAGPFAGLPLAEARQAVVERLAETGALRGSTQLRQVVGAHERCETPVEFQIRPQWFMKIRDLREPLKRRAVELTWVPEHMRRRLEDWIDGLKWDWNLSRQRHYGTPFPAWFCRDCATPVLADLDSLPVDPLSTAPPVDTCPACGGTVLHPDPDVMDTWLTSSLTPQINAGWFPEEGAPVTARPLAGRPPSAGELAPMSLRVQSFEIIRTWLFYTMVQSELHFGRLPWTSVMISGHGLNEQGRKISKRHLDRSAVVGGYNRYVPDHVIDRYGADAVRLWATKARIGTDLRFHEKEMRAGRKLAVKLFNVGRFLELHLGDDRPVLPVRDLTAVDRWLLSHLAETVDQVTAHLDRFDIMQAHQAASRFFWSIFCDRYLEMIKGRFTQPEDSREPYEVDSRASARTTLRIAFRAILGLFAPFAPFITEHLYQRWYRADERAVSLHLTAWPQPDPEWRTDPGMIDLMATVLDQVRARRTRLRLGGGTGVAAVVLHASTGEASFIARQIAEPLRVAARADKVLFAEAFHDSGVPGLSVDVIP
jgi:valyl-tRNA synthetase